MLRKLSLGVLCVFAIAACSETINGILKNSEVLTFNIKKGTVALPAGQWETQLKFKSKKEVNLEIKKDGKETAISFKVPKNVALPKENGEFELLSKDSGQPYDVRGTLLTTYKDSQEQWNWESCTYQVQRQECYYNGGHPVCYWVTHNVPGQRDVRYFLRETNRDVIFNLLTPDRTRTPGVFKGVDRYTERIYTYQGMCR